MKVKNVKKALVADWLDKFTGSESVMASLEEIFAFDEVYTITNVMSERDFKKIFSSPKKIHCSFLKITKSKFRNFLPLYPLAISSLRVNPEIELIISSSHAIAKGIQKPSSKALHISYFQARNMKYIWEEKQLYFKGYKKLFSSILPFLRRFDIKTSRNPDFIIANSNFVRDWIKEHYNISATVIYPPVDITSFELCTQKENYYITVGRLEAYKRFDIIIDAFNQTGDTLFVVGDGSQRKFLEKKAKPNVHFLGYKERNELNQILGKAKGFVFIGLEDFGIAPVEAQACGTPVICLNKGGTGETVVDGRTGVVFNNQDKESLILALKKFKHKEFDPLIIREHAEKFSAERFKKEMFSFVSQKLEFHHS